MSSFFAVCMLAVVLVLLAIFLRQDAAWAHETCEWISPLCDHSAALVIAGIVLVGLSALARA
jgi:hypothetical protein